MVKRIVSKTLVTVIEYHLSNLDVKELLRQSGEDVSGQVRVEYESQAVYEYWPIVVRVTKEEEA